MEPTETEPKLPQSTWAHSPGAKSHRAHLPDEVLEDRVAAGVALSSQLLQELLRRVRMPFQQSNDLAPERVEFALAPSPLTLAIGGLIDPTFDGFGVQLEFGCDLRDLEPALIMELAQTAKRFVIDHRAPPANARRSTSATDCTCPVRGESVARDTGVSSGKARTW